MTQSEFVAWREFHRHFPIDDFHRLYRPAALIAAHAADTKDLNGKIGALADWLQPDPAMAGFSEADQRTLAALGVAPPIRG